MKSDLGLIGIGVMGKNLAINLTNHGYEISIYDIDKDKIDAALLELPRELTDPHNNIGDFVNSLKQPKKIMLMIKAGKPVDQVIDDILPFLDDHDIIIDGGNSHFEDTIRRFNRLNQSNIEFIGMGISGGSKGAREGPSIMPGGSFEGWKKIKSIYQNISAKTKNNVPCCQWIGSDGAGHFVKTVHNGIEYSIMELIAEVYQILSEALKLDNAEVSKIFKNWNNSSLRSYLIEITSYIFSKKEMNTEQYVIDQILDKAGQKGTGRWSVHSALDNASAATMISSAVFQRIISGDKLKRRRLSKMYDFQKSSSDTDTNRIIKNIKNSLYLAIYLSYIQGFELINNSSDEYNWELSYYDISMVWQNGCIIRSQIVEEITEIFKEKNKIDTLLEAPKVQKTVSTNINSLKQMTLFAIENMIPIPGFSSALNYLLSTVTERLPANLIQAQRDYFGSHGYQKLDDEETLYHTKWED